MSILINTDDHLQSHEDRRIKQHGPNAQGCLGAILESLIHTAHSPQQSSVNLCNSETEAGAAHSKAERLVPYSHVLT